MNPWFYPYDMGALLYWYLHQTFGDGISQSLIDAAYDSDKRNVSLTELTVGIHEALVLAMMYGSLLMDGTDRKSTRLNSSHVAISYAVFCLKKKKTAEARVET